MTQIDVQTYLFALKHAKSVDIQTLWNKEYPTIPFDSIKDKLLKKIDTVLSYDLMKRATPK